MRQIGCVPTGRGKAVIGQTRLYCSKGEGFRLVEVPTEQASNEAKRLNNQGWRVDAAIPVWKSESLLRQVGVQRKQPKAPQRPNAAHWLEARRDKSPASNQSNHSQHRFSWRSTCHQGFNRWQPCEGTTGDDGVLGSGTAKTRAGEITSSDLWGVWTNQKRFIALITHDIDRAETSCSLELCMTLKASPKSKTGGWATGAETFPKGTQTSTTTFDRLQTVTVRLGC